MSEADLLELPVDIRPMRQTDYQFVYETTVKVRWPRRNAIPWAEWKLMHGPMVDHWMRAGEVRVAEAGGVLVGFIVVAPTGVAMLYVKRGFRGDGVGFELLRATHGRYTANWHECPPLRVLLPTPSWQRWCERRSIPWERAAC